MIHDLCSHHGLELLILINGRFHDPCTVKVGLRTGKDAAIASELV